MPLRALRRAEKESRLREQRGRSKDHDADVARHPRDGLRRRNRDRAPAGRARAGSQSRRAHGYGHRLTFGRSCRGCVSPVFQPQAVRGIGATLCPVAVHAAVR